MENKIKRISPIPFLVVDQEDRGYFHVWVVMVAFIVGIIIGLAVGEY